MPEWKTQKGVYWEGTGSQDIPELLPDSDILDSIRGAPWFTHVQMEWLTPPIRVLVEVRFSGSIG